MIVYYIASSILGFCCAYLVFSRIDILNQAKAIISLSSKTIRIFSSKRISDNWKEKVIPIYSLKLMASNLLLLIKLIVILAAFLLIPFIWFYFVAGSFALSLNILASIEFNLTAFIVSVVMLYGSKIVRGING